MMYETEHVPYGFVPQLACVIVSAFLVLLAENASGKNDDPD